MQRRKSKNQPGAKSERVVGAAGSKAPARATTRPQRARVVRAAATCGSLAVSSFLAILSVLAIIVLLLAGVASLFWLENQLSFDPFESSSTLEHDELLVIFPSVAKIDDAALASEVVVPIHAWVYEPEPDAVFRNFVLTAIGKAAEWVRGGSLTDEEWVHFYERGSLFFVDNQRGKKIDLRFCNRTDLTFALEPSLPSGHIYDNITVTLEQAVKCSQEHQVDAARSDTVVCPITATHHATGEHVDGEALLLRDSGWSVISDIDDTIKITMVKSKSAMLRQTFLKPFIPVDGMAALYTQWHHDTNAAFHYVSSSPWVLYRKLHEFFHDHNFPAGSFHLRYFSTHNESKDESILRLLDHPEQSKRSAIVPLLEAFPNRKFIMVGDSTEKDPEIYGRLAREYPDQIRSIIIRITPVGTDECDVHKPDEIDILTAEQQARYERAFEGVPPSKWQLFHVASQIDSSFLNE